MVAHTNDATSENSVFARIFYIMAFPDRSLIPGKA